MASGDLIGEDRSGIEGTGLLVKVHVSRDWVELNLIFILLLRLLVLDIDGVVTVLHSFSLCNKAHLRTFNLGSVRLDRFQRSGRGRGQRGPSTFQVGSQVLLPRT